jgi:hypothetical protein
MKDLEILKADLRQLHASMTSSRYPLLSSVKPSGSPPEESVPPTKPHWMGGTEDPLAEAVDGWESTLASGELRWAAIVGANERLYEAGGFDHPAIVVWSPDREFDRTPRRLLLLASGIMASIEKAETPQWMELRELLKDTATRHKRLELPRAKPGSPRLFLSSVLVFREHIPGAQLQQRLVPIRVRDDSFPAIVPYDAWSNQHRAWWHAPQARTIHDQRVILHKESTEKATPYPSSLRHCLTARGKSIRNYLACLAVGILLMYGLVLLRNSGMSRTTLVGLWLYAAFFVAFPCVFLCHQPIAWKRHQHLNDLYESIWTSKALPWTRAAILPREQSSQPPHMNLMLKVLGNDLTLIPHDRNRKLLIEFSQNASSPRDTLAGRRSSWIVDLPRNEQERSACIEGIRRLFREFPVGGES